MTPTRSSSFRSARLLLAALFCAVSVPALAQEAPLDLMAAATAPVSTAPSTNPFTLPERAAAFGRDLNALSFVAVNGTTPPVAAAPAASEKVQALLRRALALLGTPYRWGGTTPDGGFDCSGLVGYVFRTALGIELPRVSREMATSGELISDRAALTAGDLVFFGKSGRVDHVGIYVGQGNFLHAPRTGRDVTVSTLATGYWGSKFLQARRVAQI